MESRPARFTEQEKLLRRVELYPVREADVTDEDLGLPGHQVVLEDSAGGSGGHFPQAVGEREGGAGDGEVDRLVVTRHGHRVEDQVLRSINEIVGAEEGSIFNKVLVLLLSYPVLLLHLLVDVHQVEAEHGVTNYSRHDKGLVGWSVLTHLGVSQF